MTWETEQTKALSSLTVDTKVVPRERLKNYRKLGTVTETSCFWKCVWEMPSRLMAVLMKIFYIYIYINNTLCRLFIDFHSMLEPSNMWISWENPP